MSVLSSAGLGAWLYSGVTITKASAALISTASSSSCCGARPWGYAKCGLMRGPSSGSTTWTACFRAVSAVCTQRATRQPTQAGLGGPSVRVEPWKTRMFRPSACNGLLCGLVEVLRRASEARVALVRVALVPVNAAPIHSASCVGKCASTSHPIMMIARIRLLKYPLTKIANTSACGSRAENVSKSSLFAFESERGFSTERPDFCISQ